MVDRNLIDRRGLCLVGKDGGVRACAGLSDKVGVAGLRSLYLSTYRAMGATLAVGTGFGFQDGDIFYGIMWNNVEYPLRPI